jgi:hypothetical protein
VLGGGAAASCDAFACPRAAAAARKSIVACGGAGEKKADRIVQPTEFFFSAA